MKPMKALTLYAPWAHLIPLRAKLIETRGWKTDYRGPMGIHVSKKFTLEMRNMCFMEPFATALKGCLLAEKPTILGPSLVFNEDNLHLGHMIGTCNLVACIRIPEKQTVCKVNNKFGMHAITLPPSFPELAFGNYEAGRYAWILEDAKFLTIPVPIRGNRMLWDWEPKHIRVEIQPDAFVHVSPDVDPKTIDALNEAMNLIMRSYDE